MLLANSDDPGFFVGSIELRHCKIGCLGGYVDVFIQRALGILQNCLQEISFLFSFFIFGTEAP